MSETVLIEFLRIVGVFIGAWVAVRVELRWIRSDLQKVETKTNDHSVRIRALEIGE